MEKRSSIRIPSNLKVKLCLEDDVNTGTLMNFSGNGMLINTRVCFPLKSQFEILLPSGEEILKIPVKVKRLLKKGETYDGIGVELLDAPPKYLEFLDNQQKDFRIKEKKTRTFICTVCNHIAFGQAPINCPFCNGPIDNFDDNSGEVNIMTDFKALAEFEKKHFPVINIKKVSDPAPNGVPVNVHVSVGEIRHRMDVDDHITFIDFYFNDLSLNKKCIARINLNCHIITPEASLYFNDKASGVLTVISNCSAHGSWMAETSI
ncbi:MAG: hypothetical protein C4526_10695 [Nitrospiraceae bacterium]|nr:MAG: hypothetical protein C4526_10695 [Nitrospiraceae bacterium]